MGLQLGNTRMLGCDEASSCPTLCSTYLRMETAFFSIMFPAIIIELAGVDRRDFSIYEQFIYVIWFPVIMGLPIAGYPQVDVFAYKHDNTFDTPIIIAIFGLFALW